jgi:hypothetical protein
LDFKNVWQKHCEENLSLTASKGEGYPSVPYVAMYRIYLGRRHSIGENQVKSKDLKRLNEIFEEFYSKMLA